ncbi:MAG: DUF4923 family protein [Bacteroidaceae bacterium]|nr:DUF4923 family protein [Bacteroidaceae bacterium]
MKKSLILAAIAALTLTSCTSTQNTTSGSLLGNLASGLVGNNANSNYSGTGLTSGKTAGALAKTGSNLLGSLLGNLLGTNTLTDQHIIGNWNYSGVDCVFESENILSQVGGEVAAATLEGKIDTQLQKLGIKKGACQFNFKTDHTYTATLSGKSISGQWTLDAANKQMRMTYLMGMGTLTPKVALNNGTLSLLFESSKLLTLAQGIGALTNNSTATALSGLIKNYNGMYVGLQMTK